MAAPIVLLAEDITDYLNTLTLSKSFTAERRNLIRDDLSAVQTIDPKVYVVARAMESEGLTRGQDMATYYIDVAVTVAVSPNAVESNDDQIDDLLQFVDEIGRNLMRYEPATQDRYFSQSNDPIYNQNMIDAQNVFLSVLTIGYKAAREIP